MLLPEPLQASTLINTLPPSYNPLITSIVSITSATNPLTFNKVKAALLHKMRKRKESEMEMDVRRWELETVPSLSDSSALGAQWLGARSVSWEENGRERDIQDKDRVDEGSMKAEKRLEKESGDLIHAQSHEMI